MKKEIKTRQQLIERLNNIDRKCIDEGLHFHDLKSLYESKEYKLSTRDKADIKKVAAIEDDPETLKAYIDSKVVEEELQEDFYNDVIEYKGYYIEHGFYNGLDSIEYDDYTVQYCGDDYEFSSVKDAKKFIDEISEQDGFNFNEGIDIESTGVRRMPLYTARDVVNKFKQDAKKYPYWVIKTSKWYDPEGLDINNKDINIQFAGDYNECKDWIDRLIKEAKADKDTYVIEDYGDDYVKLYYPHAISKAVFSIQKNMELEEDFDGDDYEPNLSNKEIIRRIFGSFGVKLFSIVNKFDGLVLVNVDADGYREVEDTLDREIFNHGFDIVDSNVGEPNRYTERETLDITLMKDDDYNNEEDEDDLELVTDDMNAGYWYESLIEDIERYSDVIPKEERKFWYFTTHGVQPGSIPNDLNVLEIKDTPNGTFVALDGILNTSELRKYDMKEKSPNDALEESILTNDEYDYFNVYDENGLVGEFPTYEDAKNACGEGCTINGVVQYGGNEYEETPLNEDIVLETNSEGIPFEYYIYFEDSDVFEELSEDEKYEVSNDAIDDLFTFLNSDLVKDTIQEEFQTVVEDIEFVDYSISSEEIHGILYVYMSDNTKISIESLFEILDKLSYKWEYTTEITIQGPKRDVDDWDEWEVELHATAELDYSE